MVAIRVLVAEDSFLIREAMRAVLGTRADVDLVASAASLPELLALVDEHHPDVAITDVRMPPGHDDDGIRAAEQLAETHPSVGVVVLSQYLEPTWAQRLFESRSGGRAYLLKENIGDGAHLIHAVATVADGGSVMDPKVVEALVRSRRHNESSPLARLSDREVDVLRLLAEGHSNTSIAEMLHLSVRAVEKYVSTVMAKLDLPPDDSRIHRRVRATLLYLAKFED